MIEILISLCLVLALFSGLVSGVVELLAQLLKMRGKVLYEGVALILGELPNESYSFTGKLKRIFGFTESVIADPSSLTAKLFNHPLIDTLSQPGSKASYIGSTNFSAALVQTLSKDGTWASLRQELDDRNKSLGALFGPMLDEAAGNLDKFKSSVESHFNLVMDRVSGWYKRRTQAMMFCVGLVLAVSLNVDTIRIVEHLRTHPEAVAQLVKRAEEITKEAEKKADATKVGSQNVSTAGQSQIQDQESTNQLDALKKDIDRVNTDIKELKKLSLPIFWGEGTTKKFTCGDLLNLQFFLGWFLTALAATLGAPFWFDIISKLFAIRGTGKKPEESTKTTTPNNAPPVQINMPSPGAAATTAENAPLNDYEASRMNGEDIEALQRALGLSATQVNGKFSAELRTALKEWQRVQGHAVDGRFDEPTVLSILYPRA